MNSAAGRHGGRHMEAEIAEAPAVFRTAAAQDAAARLGKADLAGRRAFYTVARGSSDAAANILSYEMMAVLGVPVTSLPPSVFSLGDGVRLDDAAVLVISQSGASDDLLRSARGARAAGAAVLAITNVPASPVEAEADATLPIGAGPELAVPATKTVVGAIGAGMALLAALAPGYAARRDATLASLAALGGGGHPRIGALHEALVEAQHVYVIGRGAGLGAAQEVALKLKECCALHAEAHSASEVLHGPLQLATRPLTVLMLDTGEDRTRESLDLAEARLAAAGGRVFRLSPADLGAGPLSPAGAAALLLWLTYPLVRQVALTLGFDPDRPATLSKVTQTR